MYQAPTKHIVGPYADRGLLVEEPFFVELLQTHPGFR